MKLIIDIPEQMYLNAKADTLCGADTLVNAIKHGIPISSSEYEKILHKYVTKVINRGNCMMCGKELTEGIFFCKECETIIEADKEGAE